MDGTFSYSPALGTVLNAGADQELEVTFTPADTTNYDPATKTVKLTVNKGDAKSAVGDRRSDCVRDAAQRHAAERQLAAAGSFTFSPDVGTILNVGTSQKLVATFTPDNPNYATLVQTREIDVTKAPQEITFAQPADLVAGRAAGAEGVGVVEAGGRVCRDRSVHHRWRQVSATAAGPARSPPRSGDDNYLAAKPVVRTLTVAPSRALPQARARRAAGRPLGQRCVIGRQRNTTALALNLRTSGAPKLTFR